MSSFWYKNASTGERSGPAYDYATLEKLAGKSREEFDFPFLLSTKRNAAKLLMCCDPQKHTGGLDDPAHQFPYPKFLDDVRQHFGEPVAQRAPSPAARSSPGKGRARQ